MVTVKFNDAGEFLGEIETDREQVERSIVRVTCRFRRNEMFTALSVVATAVVGDSVVQLEARCGEYMSHDGPDGKEVRTRADAESERLRTKLSELGLDVRSGSFEAAA